MADIVTSQKLLDGSRKVVYKFTNHSDGTGESAVTKIDVSGLSPAADTVSIERIVSDIYGMQVKILWDATVDQTAWILGPGQMDLDLRAFGGIYNPKTAGYTGDIKFSTINHTSGDTYSIILVCRKDLTAAVHGV